MDRIKTELIEFFCVLGLHRFESGFIRFETTSTTVGMGQRRGERERGSLKKKSGEIRTADFPLIESN